MGAKAKNVKTPKSMITLNNTKMELRFDLNAMIELEDRYGSIDEAFQKAQEGNMKALRTLIWAGLIHSNPELTEQEVGSWIDIKGLQSMTEELGAAVTASQPTAEALKESKN